MWIFKVNAWSEIPKYDSCKFIPSTSAMKIKLCTDISHKEEMSYLPPGCYSYTLQNTWHPVTILHDLIFNRLSYNLLLPLWCNIDCQSTSPTTSCSFFTVQFKPQRDKSCQFLMASCFHVQDIIFCQSEDGRLEYAIKFSLKCS